MVTLVRPMYRITERIWQGGYPMSEDFQILWNHGVRWLFNLDLPYYEWRELEESGLHIVSVDLKDIGKDRPERWWQALVRLGAHRPRSRLRLHVARSRHRHRRWPRRSGHRSWWDLQQAGAVYPSSATAITLIIERQKNQPSELSRILEVPDPDSSLGEVGDLSPHHGLRLLQPGPIGKCSPLDIGAPRDLVDPPLAIGDAMNAGWDEGMHKACGHDSRMLPLLIPTPGWHPMRSVLPSWRGYAQCYEWGQGGVPNDPMKHFYMSLPMTASSAPR